MRRSQTLVLVVILLAAPGVVSAQGCGPTRLKVAESVSIDAPADKVWAAIGNFQDMSWDDDTISTRGSGGNVPERASRAVTFKGGAVLEESLYKYDPAARSYSYHIDRIDVTRFPVQNVSATIEVVPEAGGAKSIVRWKSAFYRYLTPGEGAPDKADAKAAHAMEGFLRAGLGSLKTKASAKS